MVVVCRRLFPRPPLTCHRSSPTCLFLLDDDTATVAVDVGAEAMVAARMATFEADLTARFEARLDAAVAAAVGPLAARYGDRMRVQVKTG